MMKPTFIRLTALLVGVVIFVSCNERFNDLQSQIDDIRSEQIDDINKSISSLETVDASLHSYIESLQKEDETIKSDIESLRDKGAELSERIATLESNAKQIEAQITVLQEKDSSLESQISELKEYVDKQINATKDWASSTFSTLEQFNALSESVSGIRSDMDSHSSKLTQVSEDLAAAKSSLEKSISDLETTLKSWVEGRLAEYYTKKETDEQLSALGDSLLHFKTDLAGLSSKVESLIKLIQSVVVMPSYSDGSVSCDKFDNNVFYFEVLPAGLAGELAEAGVSVFRLQTISTQTKAAPSVSTLAINSVTAEGNVLAITVSGESLPDAFFNYEYSISASLQINYAYSSYATAYFPLYSLGSEDPNNPDEDTEQPTEDMMGSVVNTRTFVFQAEYAGAGDALIKRLLNTSGTFDESIGATVVHDGLVPSLSDQDYSDIMTLIARGGCVVYCSATSNNVDIFIRNLQRIGSALKQNGGLSFTEDGFEAYNAIMLISETDGKMLPKSLSLHDTNGVLCDIYAFKGRDKYIVADLNEPQDIITVTTNEGDGADAAPTEDMLTLSVDNANSKYLTGLHADGLAEWIDGQNKSRGQALLYQAANVSSTYMDLDKVSKAHTERFSFTAYGAHKQAPVTVLYEIWPVNNTDGDDYYLIHQHIAVENSKLKCGPEEENKWNRYRVNEFYGDGRQAYHAYMSGVKNEIKLLGDNVSLDYKSPTNNIGTSSFSESSGWSLSTSFINPTLSGGISMSKSWSYTVNDLEMTYTARNKDGATQWEYNSTSHPWMKQPNYHGQCKDTQKNDFDLDFCWVWCVENADKQYSFQGKITVEMEGTWKDVKYFSKRGYKTFSTTFVKNIDLPQPPRYEQEWNMRMTPNNYDAFRLLQEKLPNHWKQDMYLYTVTADDTIQIDRWIDRVSTILEKNPIIVKDAFNVKETDPVSFSLEWKRLDQSKAYKKVQYNF